MNRLARFLAGIRHSDQLVTVVKLNGILQSSIGRSPSAKRLINVERVEKWLRRAFLPTLRPAAVAIQINSPGGSPTQAELVHDLIRSYSKKTGIKVYTFAEDIAASGGYWLLCSGDQMYACNTSLVGSIGVISATLGAVEAAHKLGFERRVYTSGREKLSLDPLLPVKPEQEEVLKDIMEDLHDSFKELVKQSRGQKLSTSDNVFSGRVWTGRQAVQLGLVDGLGSYEQVMRGEFGDTVKFLLCSEATSPGFRDLIGLKSERRRMMTYEACRDLSAAAMDEMEERVSAIASNKLELVVSKP